ncbi:MAG: nucleotide sugar dehydrogenase [Elusimicrobia bacterium]|nr:nucleotide sugar dehydrogenase [Elusimicrobiota bacterium]
MFVQYALVSLEKSIKDKSARIGILGLGYVGLPLGVEFARKGFSVVGFEVNPAVIAGLNKGRSHVADVPSSALGGLLSAGRFKATGKFDELARMDAVIICVPTPLRKSKEPDVSYILKATKEIAPRLRKGQLVVLESTTYPGTTKELVLPLIQSESGLKVGRDFQLAFSPERVDPGNRTYKIHNTPKVVGGVTPACTELAARLYGEVVNAVVSVTSTEAAEMVKLLENTFRAVNIGLVNELAQMCHRLRLNVWEIIGAAATKPFGYMPFYPGPGIGGHCIPLDPHYLAWKMKSLNFEPRFIELAGVINSAMPEFVVRRLAEILNLDGRSVRGSRVLVLGVAYKPNVPDMRESPAIDVVKLLADQGAKVAYHDPHVPTLEVEGIKLASKPLSDATLRSADVVAVLTAHSQVDYRRVAARARRVFDARNAMNGQRGSKVFRL